MAKSDKNVDVITTTWAIQWMQTSTQPVNGFNEVVLNVGWTCIGTDGTYTSSIYNTQMVVPPQEGDPNFIPYADLTEAEVLGWVWAAGVNQAATEEAVAQQVETLANPPVVQPPLPWATE